MKVEFASRKQGLRVLHMISVSILVVMTGHAQAWGPRDTSVQADFRRLDVLEAMECQRFVVTITIWEEQIARITPQWACIQARHVRIRFRVVLASIVPPG